MKSHQFLHPSYIVIKHNYRGIIASIVGLVYRAKLIIGNDLGWDTASAYIAVLVQIFPYVYSLIYSLCLSLTFSLSSAENGVAIIVGCLPGFTTFLQLSVLDTSFLKSVRSKWSGSDTGKTTPYASRESPAHPKKIWTFGSPERVAPRYYELSDTHHLDTEITTLERVKLGTHTDESGIMRTVGFSQNIYSEQSSKRFA